MNDLFGKIKGVNVGLRDEHFYFFWRFIDLNLLNRSESLCVLFWILLRSLVCYCFMRFLLSDIYDRSMCCFRVSILNIL